MVAPRFGGPASYWLENLRSSQQLLERLQPVLDGLDIQCVIFPHFLSGPLDAGQRIHFLRFHMKRHRGQVEDIIPLSGFLRTDLCSIWSFIFVAPNQLRGQPNVEDKAGRFRQSPEALVMGSWPRVPRTTSMLGPESY